MHASLEDIVKTRKLAIEAMKSSRLLDSMPKPVSGDGTFLEHVDGEPNLICEIKPASPSMGVLGAHTDIEEIVSVYTSGGAAISVLTEPTFFQGSFELLARVRALTKLPLLCKDFVLDTYQCLLARACGAQAVLLIAKILDDSALRRLKQDTESLGMVAVIEVQNKNELERALRLDPQCILINNRNLDTFEIDLNTTSALAPFMPKSATVISASGIESPAEIARLMPHCSIFLVGSSLMNAPNLRAKLAELKRCVQCLQK